jgi:hypothetical protein
VDRSRTMNCEDVRKELVAHLAGELGEALRGAIDGHLPGCRPCRDERARLEATGAILDAFLSSPEVAGGSEAAVLDALSEASPTALAVRVGGPFAASGSVRRGRRSAAVGGRRSARVAGRSREAGAGLAVAFGAAAVVLFSLFTALSQSRQQGELLLASRRSGTSGESAPSIGSASEPGEVREPAADPAQAGLTRSGTGGVAVVGDRSDGATDHGVGRAGPGSGREAGTPGSESEATGAVPDELRENPDMFLDFVIVRRLEKLRRLPELLADTRAGGEEAG